MPLGDFVCISNNVAKINLHSSSFMVLQFDPEIIQEGRKEDMSEKRKEGKEEPAAKRPKRLITTADWKQSHSNSLLDGHFLTV